MYSKSDNKSDIQEALRAAIEYANPSRKKVEKKKKTTTNTTKTVNKLEDLIKDFESGKISKKEFDKKKKELIGN